MVEGEGGLRVFAASELNQGLFTNAPRLAGRLLYIAACRVAATRRKLRDLRPRPHSASSRNTQFRKIDRFGPWRHLVPTGTMTAGTAAARSAVRQVGRRVFSAPRPKNQQTPSIDRFPGWQGRRDFWHVRSAQPKAPPCHPTYTGECRRFSSRPRCH